MKDGYFVTRTYRAGCVYEKIKYYVSGKRPTRCGGRVAASEIKKQEQNERQTIREAARVLNANFKAGDITLGLDYSDEGLERLRARARAAGETEDLYAAAEHELKLFLRRVKRACESAGVELKYAVAVTSDTDAKSGRTVRVHHHLVVNREAFSAATEKWTLGGVHAETLSAQPDYTAVAEYFIKQTRKIQNAKKFVCSRNLMRPVPKDRIVPSNAEIRVPRGGVLLHRSEFKPDRPQYIRYFVPTAGSGELTVDT